MQPSSTGGPKVGDSFPTRDILSVSQTSMLSAFNLPACKKNMSSEASEDSGTTSRSRTVCALCRQRKTKCDRQLPKCGFCVKAKVECQYLPQPKKRGLRAGYVAELESRLASLEKQIETIRSLPPVAPAPPTTNLDGHAQQHSPRITLSRANISPTHTSTPHNIISDTNAATADMMSLPLSFFYTLAELWFTEDHKWVPILERDHIRNSLAALHNPVDQIPDVVLRAVIALKIAYSSQAICLGYKGRRRLSMYLRSQVLVEAMAKPSLSSIQALFIVALLDIGSDDIPSAFNIMSMCRRTGEHIGIFRQLLVRIQSQSPAQVGPPDREFVMDNISIAVTWAVIAVDAVSSLGVSWRDTSVDLADHLLSVAYLSAPDFRESFNTHIHLCAIGIRPVHEYFLAHSKGEHQVLEDQALATTEEMYQNLMSYINGMPTPTYTVLADGVVDYDINYIFSRMLSNGAVIMIYQRYVLDGVGHVQLAKERCIDSYHQIVDVIRNISDVDAEITSPMFVNIIAVAARFKLVFDRALGQPRGSAFDILMHGINMCGRRWPLARRIDIVLRAAIVEVDTGVPCGLPEEFWDLKQSGLDISESMKRWVSEYKQSLYVGSLNGPYA
ncbi:hypothetical protein LTR70_004923 [Exophiala xenobiotica]|uniref:Zn(2)-C6 fungal-type domain-containing protein n=1 Tax=Lithohypha guttulata TaxID=1690604 RepID=A0ABR0KBL4_9EURO|nr:hypothetical protein LTR24_004545 [Lithohypha guttulata]KAK5319739.1 hypothetical protein LTR70_004923 [Exophiala xenobiotica]